MNLIVKSLAGICAVAFAATLTYVVWPRADRNASSRHPAVEQPVFAESPKAPTAATTEKDAGIAKLAAALSANPSQPQPPAGATRGITALPAEPAAHASAPPSVSFPQDAKKLSVVGLLALADGDVVGARAILERAARAGDPRAFLTIGDTYDPSTLAHMGALGLKGDAGKAREYYAKAVSAGVPSAKERLASLDSQ